MKCSIVKELLPIYWAGLTSEETNADIREHLEHCRECQAFYEYKVIAAETVPKPDEEETAVELLKELKWRIRRNRVIAAITTLVLLTGLILFARNYLFPLPFNANRMLVETFQGVYAVIDGWPGSDTETLQSLDSLDLETTRAVLNGEYDIVESIMITSKGINGAIRASETRIIERGGEEVNVVYFCCYKTLWESIFNGDFASYSESLTSFGLSSRKEYDEARKREPRMTEVYYLPSRELLDYFEELSDEEFDAMREEAQFIWSGTAVW